MTPQSNLKNNLIKGLVSKRDFIQKLLNLDQATLEHENCFENIEVMENKQIKQIFETSDDETRFIYYHYLRLFYFHAFQHDACTIGTSEKAIKYLESANLLSSTLEKILPNEDPLFAKYILGTLFYVKNDSNSLLKVIEEYEQGDKNNLTYSNIYVLKRLYKGLISKKSSDYKRDY